MDLPIQWVPVGLGAAGVVVPEFLQLVRTATPGLPLIKIVAKWGLEMRGVGDGRQVHQEGLGADHPY